MGVFKYLSFIAAPMFLAVTLGAQTPDIPAESANQAAAAAAPFGMTAGIGSATIDGKTYQSLSTVLDVPLGPVGLGLDVKIHYQFYRFPSDELGIYLRSQDWFVDEDNDARPDAWEEGMLQKYLDMYLSRIVYLRYGNKGDPLYAKIGLFEDGVLGNGFILGGYSNGLLRPEYNYVGLAFDMDGALFGFPLVGFETFTNSLSGFDVLGGRFYIRPLKILPIPVFSDLQIGASAVVDRDPYAMLKKTDADTAEEVKKAADLLAAGSNIDTNTSALVWGIDLRQPLVNLPGVFTMALFADYAVQKNSFGLMTGLGGNLLVMNYSAQVRRLGENFQATYYDRSYDISRSGKFKTYLGLNGFTTPTFNGWFFQMGTSLLEGKIAFRTSVEGPLGTLENADPDNPALWPKIRSSLKVDGTKLLPVPLSLTGFYDKDLIKDISSIFSPKDALIGAVVSYQIGVATLNLVYNVRYIPDDSITPEALLADPSLASKPWEITSKLETVIKLF